MSLRASPLSLQLLRGHVLQRPRYLPFLGQAVGSWVVRSEAVVLLFRQTEIQ